MSTVDVDDPLQAEALRRLLDARLLRTIVVTVPALGAEWTQTVPAGTYWELLNVHAILTTSAVVANRTPRLQLRDSDTTIIGTYPAAAAIAASTASRNTWAAGYGSVNTISGATAALPAPTLILAPAWRLDSFTNNLDAGDAWSAITLLVRELTPDRIRQQRDWLAQ